MTGLALMVLGLAGAGYGFSTLPTAVCVTIANLVVGIVRRRPPVLRLLDFWEFGFLYLFGSEVLVSLSDVRADFGPQLTCAAEGFLVAAFGASLAGYEVGRFVRRLRPRRPAAQIRYSRRPRQLALTALSTIILMYVALAVSPGEPSVLRSTRDSLASAAFPTVAAAMVIQCALTVQGIVTSRRLGGYLYPLGVAVLSFAVLYVVGTRFFLGFFVSGVLFYVARLLQPLSRRRLASFAIALLALAAIQGTMRLIRGGGIAAAELDDVASSLSHPATYLSGEGMIRVHAWVHEKQVYARGGRPLEHAFMLYWWVPRVMWPSKPTMDGYWLAHEVMADGDVGSGHSVAGGFALPALLDFGPQLGIVVCLLYGLGLSWLDGFAARHRNSGDPASIFTSILPFAIFFAMRSPQTSVIFLESCLAMYLPVFIMTRLSAAKRQVPVPTVVMRRSGRLRAAWQ